MHLNSIHLIRAYHDDAGNDDDDLAKWSPTWQNEDKSDILERLLFNWFNKVQIYMEPNSSQYKCPPNVFLSIGYCHLAFIAEHTFSDFPSPTSEAPV